MKILVAVASKHGATRDIAQAIANELSQYGHETIAQKIEDVQDLATYDAVVLGSAVYAGNWLVSARAFVQQHQAELLSKPVWLFSSGPVGSPLKPSSEAAVTIDLIMKQTQARGHRIFAGKLDKRQLSFTERAIVLAARTAEGDFRNWIDVKNWADQIANELPQ